MTKEEKELVTGSIEHPRRILFAEDKKKAFNAGMNGFVSKPVDTKQLYDVLKREVKENGQ